ncbi:Spore germination protein GerD [Lentibacillus sp. JNUCC-1]|uniref:spore germination lipoprotein GerD n=1 Tax=Lentibacillus sp. JNUCC-1 TaxID=2654513 RepID=UPI0012E7DE48|nr:spore germination lipoprotein GerD [Lentibacillus sp. JNUCC-1]MUV38131.1 Spore germination protein GerD [Lentibacillus sp. JNUCC-1]
MIRKIIMSLSLLSIIVISACGGEGESAKEADYETTKKMVVDILQTEDGKKALNEILSDEKMKQHLVMESDMVKNAINESMASEKGAEMWKKLFEDPEFVKKYAESMSKEQKELMKALMQDAEFQKQMLEILKDPKMTEQYLTVIKSQEFSAHLEETIQKTLETPTFQAKMQDILLKAAEKQAAGKESGGKKEEEQPEGGGSGGEGGGGSGSEGG